MNRILRGFYFWTPCVLVILIFCLLNFLSTDVFAKGRDFWQSLLRFLIHMLPAFTVLLLLVFAWRWEWVGALGFIAFAIWHVAIP